MSKLFGRQAFLELLASEGVTHLFGNPGTTELPIMQAVPDYPQIKFVLGLQEAIVVAMADGFARASRRLTAANVHVAPGLGNAMGALYNAKFSGSPVIVTAGQQEQGHGLLEPLLYEPLPPIAAPLVKWAVEVTRVQDLPRIMRRAAKVAMTRPMGRCSSACPATSSTNAPNSTWAPACASTTACGLPTSPSPNWRACCCRRSARPSSPGRNWRASAPSMKPAGSPPCWAPRCTRNRFPMPPRFRPRTRSSSACSRAARSRCMPRSNPTTW